MSETLFKKLVIIIGLAMLICLIPLIISIINDTGSTSIMSAFLNWETGPLTIILAFLLGLAYFTEITIISIRYSDNKKFRIVIYTLIPVGFVLTFVFAFFAETDLLIIFSGIVLLFAPISIALFIFPKRRTTLFLYILIGLIFAGLVMKRFHIIGAGACLTACQSLLGIGIFIYGIKSLFLIRKNRYLSITIPVCSFIIALVSIGALFKIQHWPGAGIILQFNIVSIILITIIALLTLPQSGFFNWNPEYKKLFYRNTVVPWLIVVFLIGFYFLAPPSTKEKIFPPRHEFRTHFNMFPYDLEQADVEDSYEK